LRGIAALKYRVAHVTAVDISLYLLLLNQLCSIQAEGYEVVGISSPGKHSVKLAAAGIEHIPVTIVRNLAPFRDLLSLWQLYRVFRREKFTIVHTHTPKPSLLGQLAARLAGVPIVVNTIHGFYFHDNMSPRSRQFYIMMEKIAARCSDVILSQNREDIQTAIQKGICKPAKIKYLGNGISLSVFDPARVSPEAIRHRREDVGLPPDASVVGFVGRLAARRKGFINFLAAAQRVARETPQAYFLIVGEADHGKPDAVEPQAAREYGIADRCRFVGQRPNAELPEWYSLIDVLALPSLFEGVPRVVMEAAAMGVPAIVTDVKGNREAVQHGRNGLLVPLGDVQALADAIIEILSDREKAQRMGEEGRRIALERFDERLVFKRVKAEYARLLREKGFPLPQVRQD